MCNLPQEYEGMIALNLGDVHCFKFYCLTIIAFCCVLAQQMVGFGSEWMKRPENAKNYPIPWCISMIILVRFCLLISMMFFARICMSLCCSPLSFFSHSKPNQCSNSPRCIWGCSPAHWRTPKSRRRVHPFQWIEYRSECQCLRPTEWCDRGKGPTSVWSITWWLLASVWPKVEVGREYNWFSSSRWRWPC